MFHGPEVPSYRYLAAPTRHSPCGQYKNRLSPKDRHYLRPGWEDAYLRSGRTLAGHGPLTDGRTLPVDLSDWEDAVRLLTDHATWNPQTAAALLVCRLITGTPARRRFRVNG